MWRDRAGVLKGKGVPYSQMRIVARVKWQLYHLKGVLERGGLKPHVVLAGDNSDMADAAEEEDLANAPPSHDKAIATFIHLSSHQFICPLLQLSSIHPSTVLSVHSSTHLSHDPFNRGKVRIGHPLIFSVT